MTAIHRGFALTSLALATFAVLPQRAAAQDTDHSRHPPATMQPIPSDSAPKATAPPESKDDHRRGGATEMDHDAMGHDAMGHDRARTADRPGGLAPASAAHGGHGHGHETARSPTHHDGEAGAEPKEPIPALTDADRAAAFPEVMSHDHGERIDSYFLINRLESFNDEAGRALKWEGQGWIGGDKHRLWVRSEGERTGAKTESADLQVLYGRSIAPWWDVVVGLRHDFKPAESQSFVAFGVQGLAPQKFEIEASGFVGERGQTALRFEAEYDLLLTNRLILQPLIEVNLYGRNDRARGVGSGLSTFEAGLRIRYEVTRKIAPYVGIVHERAYGDTADFRRDEFERVDDTRIVVGFRTWF